MKLYYSKGACSLIIRIMINELGLDSKYVAVNLKTKQTENGEDFTLINPKGAVPTLQLNNDEILTENLVILQYLADANHADRLLPPIGDFKRYRTLEWANFITTEIHKGFGPLFNPAVPDDLKQNVVIPNLQKKFAFLDKHLQENKFLMGNEFTIADMYLYVMLRWAKGMKVDLSSCSQLDKYFGTIDSRKAVQHSLQQEETANTTS